jgi:NAD(P)-dependent dehydrogenase (short-subunit alcohol dehydrogenase family)
MSAAAFPVAFVTGAARGIGLAIARWFFQHGHRVAVIDNDAATLTVTEATLRAELGERAGDLLVIPVQDYVMIKAIYYSNTYDSGDYFKIKEWSYL